jgi:hypothetical protein
MLLGTTFYCNGQLFWNKKFHFQDQLKVTETLISNKVLPKYYRINNSLKKMFWNL